MEQKKAISYSLFGYGKDKHRDCFDFPSYLRGLLINVRLNRILFPDWDVVLHVDHATYEAYGSLLDKVVTKVHIHQEAPLCMAMLWRMATIYEYEHPNWIYSHVIMRDLDSPATYRDAQAVQHWIERDTAMHAITDSVSHNLHLLGGMIGARPEYFSSRVAQSFEELVNLDRSIDYRNKGADQTFLNKVVYPMVADKGSESITQHYFNGMPQTFLNNYYTCNCPPATGHQEYCPLNIEVPNVSKDLAESNAVCGHIGAAGYYEGELFRFLRKYWDYFDDLIKAEKEYPQIFYWNNQ